MGDGRGRKMFVALFTQHSDGQRSPIDALILWVSHYGLCDEPKILWRVQPEGLGPLHKLGDLGPGAVEQEDPGLALRDGRHVPVVGLGRLEDGLDREFPGGMRTRVVLESDVQYLRF